MLKTLKFLLYAYFAAIILKIVIMTFDGKLIRYSLKDLSVDGVLSPATWDKKSPKLLTLNPTIYKLVNGSIIANTGGSMKQLKSPECTVMDLKNWECIWQEKDVFHDGKMIESLTLREAMENGSYSFASSEWSFEEIETYNNYNDVGLLHYHIAGCNWDFYDGLLNGLIMCPLRFAFDYG